MSLLPSASSAARYVPTGKCSTEMGSLDCGTRLRLNIRLPVAASSTISNVPGVIVPASQEKSPDRERHRVEKGSVPRAAPPCSWLSGQPRTAAGPVCGLWTRRSLAQPLKGLTPAPRAIARRWSSACRPKSFAAISIRRTFQRHLPNARTLQSYRTCRNCGFRRRRRCLSKQTDT
jgi:hypothetical protein